MNAYSTVKIAAVLMVAFLAACDGGGGSSPTPVNSGANPSPSPSPNPTPSPTPNPSPVGAEVNTPVVLESRSEDVEHPQLAVQDDGEAVVIFEQDENGRRRIWSTQYKNGNWTTPAIIDDPSQGGDYHVQTLSSNRHGQAIALFKQFVPGALSADLWAAYYTNGAWSAPEVVVSGLGLLVSADVAIDQTGAAALLWLEDDSSAMRAYAKRYSASDGWSNKELIQSSANDAGLFPQVVMDNSGNAAAVWIEYQGGDTRLMSNLFFGGAWQGDTVLESTALTLLPTNKDVVMFAEKQVVVTWDTIDEQFIPTVYSRRFSSNAWEPSENLGAGSIARMSTDFNGHATLTFGTTEANFNNNVVAFQMLATGWGTEQTLIANVLTPFEPSVDMNGRGEVVVLWQQLSNTNQNLRLTRFDGTAWNTPQTVNMLGRSDNGFDQHIGIDANGEAVAIWLEGPDLVASRF